MAVFIGGAWPYANGSLHLGHISSLLPGDILARYYRLKGEKVVYVSGSDCNGTPISIRANQEGTTPERIADRYHEEFQQCFQSLGFTYDCYTRTDTEHHHKVVQEIFLTLLEKGFIYKKEVDQTYCEPCNQFLPDRYVEGSCPNCGSPARGDQCDECSAILDPLDLLHKTCKLCGGVPTVRSTEHFYFALSRFQDAIRNYTAEAKTNQSWRDNALGLTERYIREGLLDRAATRDLPNGVSVPLAGYEEKKIYVWIEAVSGYYSASRLWEKEQGEAVGEYWSGAARTYYVHGKDNIPFHTIIWPAILMALDIPALPAHIVSSEYLTLEKRKLSTSRNWAVWIPDLLERYHPDSIRYFLTINAPESRDTDFSWREFIYSHNSELLGAYGNLVNRTFKFIEKYYGGILPSEDIDAAIQAEMASLYERTGNLIEKAHFKEALETIFAAVRGMNKYFDHEQPWKQVLEDKQACGKTIGTCAFAITNLAQLLEPFLPFSSEEVKNMLGRKGTSWKVVWNQDSGKLLDVHPLFRRIEVNLIEEELEKLKLNAIG